MEARPRPNTEYAYRGEEVRSIDECEQKCTQWNSCNVFAFDKRSPQTFDKWSKWSRQWQPFDESNPLAKPFDESNPLANWPCRLYPDAELVPNSNFDSGVRKKYP